MTDISLSARALPSGDGAPWGPGEPGVPTGRYPYLAVVRQLLLIAPAGMLAGHAVGYLVAPSHLHAAGVADAHTHVPALATVAVPIAIVALLVLSLREPRRPRPRALWWLAGLQAAAYAGMEVTERAAAGLDVATAAHDPAVLAGLAAQLLVASAIVVLEHVARRLGTVLFDALGRRGPATEAGRLARLFIVTSHLADRQATWRTCPRRGPPPALLAS